MTYPVFHSIYYIPIERKEPGIYTFPHNDHVTFDFYTIKVGKNYHAYLIRFKRREAQSSWCATLEDIHTRETLTFGTERELLVYLLRILSGCPGSPDANPDSDNEDKFK